MWRMPAAIIRVGGTSSSATDPFAALKTALLLRSGWGLRPGQGGNQSVWIFEKSTPAFGSGFSSAKGSQHEPTQERHYCSPWQDVPASLANLSGERVVA